MNKCEKLYARLSYLELIPDNIEGHTVSKILGHAFENNNILKSVIIPESITFIGDQAFWFVDANLGYEQQVKVSIYCTHTTGYSPEFQSLSQPLGLSPALQYIDWNVYDTPVVWNCMQNGITPDGIKWGLTNDGVMTVAGYCGKSDVVEQSEKAFGPI